MGATAAAFAGIREAEHFTDTAGLAHGIAAYARRAAGALFAVALSDASITGQRGADRHHERGVHLSRRWFRPAGRCCSR